MFDDTKTKGGTVTAVVGKEFTLTFSGTEQKVKVTIDDGFLTAIQGLIIGTDGNTLKEITEKKTLTPAGNPSITNVSGTYGYADKWQTVKMTFNKPNFTMTGTGFGMTITAKGTYTVSEGIITATIKTVQAPPELSDLMGDKLKPGDTGTFYILSATQICSDEGELYTKQ